MDHNMCKLKMVYILWDKVLGQAHGGGIHEIKGLGGKQYNSIVSSLAFLGIVRIFFFFAIL
jgi:hypothetical protein